MSDFDRGWVVGLTDGEGSFILNTRIKKSEYKSVQFDFKLSQRSDDVQMLQKARVVLGGVGVWGSDKAKLISDGSGGFYRGNPVSTLIVSAKYEIRRVISFFEKNPLQSKKAKDFEIWREAFIMYNSTLYEGRYQHKVMPDGMFEKMVEFSRLLKDGRKYKLAA